MQRSERKGPSLQEGRPFLLRVIKMEKKKAPVPRTRAFLEVTPGFEPGNQGFADPCLTTWLCRHVRGQSIFPSPISICTPAARYYPGARPAAVACKKIREPIFAPIKNGAGDGARTRYLHLGKVALYQMSYARKWCLRSESNQRHADFQSAALPTELQRHMGHLRARMENGDPERARTVDLQRDRLAF